LHVSSDSFVKKHPPVRRLSGSSLAKHEDEALGKTLKTSRFPSSEDNKKPKKEKGK